MTELNLVHFLAKHQKNRSRQLTRAVLFLSMEMRGIEPLSKRISSLTSTIIVILLKLH